MVKEQRENGVVILEKPQEIDHLQFATEHIGCDAIVDDDVDIHPRNTHLYAYATSAEFNKELYRIFLSIFKKQGRVLVKNIGERQALGLV